MTATLANPKAVRRAFGPVRFAIVPYEWRTTPMPHWRLPGTSGVDLRPLPAQRLQGTPDGFGFAVFGVPGSATMQAAWDHLTAGSDPSGENGPKPLMPTTKGRLELHLGGRIISEPFQFGLHPHTGKVRDLLRRDFERQWEASNGSDHCRRILDFTCEKYRVDDWREFVPPRLHAHVKGRLPHQTTITESFNKADSGTLGPDLSWTELQGDWEVKTNRAAQPSSASGDNAKNRCRADSNLSSDDHESYTTQYYPTSGLYAGPACRMPSDTTEDFYCINTQGGDNTIYLIKIVGGSQTNLATASQTAADGTVAKVQANGSDIKGFYGGSEKVSVTDTAITGNVRCGLMQYGRTANGSFDDFTAADLGGAAFIDNTSNILRALWGGMALGN